MEYVMADQENECSVAFKVKIDFLEKENASRKNDDVANILDNVKKMLEASIKSTTETVIIRFSNEQNRFSNRPTN